MTPSDRPPDRDTLLLVASIVAEGETPTKKFRVRNLSAGGIMVEGEHDLRVGARVGVTLRNIGAVVGKVAWVKDKQYGIAFDRDIDPQAVRAPVALADYLSETVKLRASGAA